MESSSKPDNLYQINRLENINSKQFKIRPFIEIHHSFTGYIH